MDIGAIVPSLSMISMANDDIATRVLSMGLDDMRDSFLNIKVLYFLSKSDRDYRFDLKLNVLRQPRHLNA